MFKNPATIPAGKLIDELGLKGTRVGGAVVSREHGNFIINEGKATAQDIEQLIEHIKTTVKEKFNIDLKPEVRIVGEYRGVVDQATDRTERRLRTRQQPGDGFFIGEIGSERNRRTAVILN